MARASILTGSSGFVRPVSDGGNVYPWQRELKAAVRDVGELCHQLKLPASVAKQGEKGTQQFMVFAPPSFLRRIRKGDLTDPLLRQILPVADEQEDVAGFTRDPVADNEAALAPGILKKYEGRALLITTGSCAVHCRYCFRRHFPYQDSPHGESAWEGALSSVQNDKSIHEVILSGGDPLMLVDDRLANLISMIAAIPHVTRLRIHTRLPIMIPSRVTDRLLALLSKTRLRSIFVIHANHAREVDAEVSQSLTRLKTSGTLLLNQAVLLRGVNDSAKSLRELSERLVEVGVLPYYLHQLDRVQGAAHFEVPVSQGKEIMASLTKQLPGYMVPKYVQELPGQPSKTLL